MFYFYLCVLHLMCRCVWRPEEGDRSRRARVTAGGVLLDTVKRTDHWFFTRAVSTLNH